MNSLVLSRVLSLELFLFFNVLFGGKHATLTPGHDTKPSSDACSLFPSSPCNTDRYINTLMKEGLRIDGHRYTRHPTTADARVTPPCAPSPPLATLTPPMLPPADSLPPTYTSKPTTMSSPQPNAPASHLMDPSNVGRRLVSQDDAQALEASFRRTPPTNSPTKRPRTEPAPLWVTAREALRLLENAPAASPELSPGLSPELCPTQHSSSSGASPDPPELNASAEPGLSATAYTQGQQPSISSDSTAGPPEARHIAVVQSAQLPFSAPPHAATSTAEAAAAPAGLGPGVTAETNQAAAVPASYGTSAVPASYGTWAIARKPFDPNPNPETVLVVEWPTAAAQNLRKFAIVMVLRPGQDCCNGEVLRASMRFVHKANLTPCPAPCWVPLPLKFKSKAQRTKWAEEVKQAWAAALGNTSPVVGPLSFKDYLLKYRPGTPSNALYGTNLILDRLISAREVDPSSSSTPRKHQQDINRHKHDAAHKEIVQKAYEKALPADPSPSQCAETMASARHNVEAGTFRATSRASSTARNGLRSESKPLSHTHCAACARVATCCALCARSVNLPDGLRRRSRCAPRGRPRQHNRDGGSDLCCCRGPRRPHTV